MGLTTRDLEVFGGVWFDMQHNSCPDALLRSEIPIQYQCQPIRWFDTPDPDDEKTPEGVPDPRERKE